MLLKRNPSLKNHLEPINLHNTSYVSRTAMVLCTLHSPMRCVKCSNEHLAEDRIYNVISTSQMSFMFRCTFSELLRLLAIQQFNNYPKEELPKCNLK